MITQNYFIRCDAPSEWLRAGEDRVAQAGEGGPLVCTAISVIDASGLTEARRKAAAARWFVTGTGRTYCARHRPRAIAVEACSFEVNP